MLFCESLIEQDRAGRIIDWIRPRGPVFAKQGLRLSSYNWENGEILKNINSPLDLYQFASKKFSFLLGLGFEQTSENEKTCFASNWLKLCLINERFETRPQDMTFFLPEETKTPSLYIALQYYMSDYWGAWRSAEEESREKLRGQPTYWNPCKNGQKRRRSFV